LAKSKRGSKKIYKIGNESGKFKRDSVLSNQIQRAAISIMSNIAEGFGRNSENHISRFTDSKANDHLMNKEREAIKQCLRIQQQR